MEFAWLMPNGIFQHKIFKRDLKLVMQDASLSKRVGNNKKAFVTIAIGEKYLGNYNKYFRHSHKRLAARTGYNLIVITDYIDRSDYGKTKSPAWQKLLIFRLQETKRFDILCWIDADIYVTNNIIDPFENVDELEWAAVRNNIYNFDWLAKADLNMYSFCPENSRPQYIMNTGFFIVNRNIHAQEMEYVYTAYEDQPCYEQGALSYHLLNTTPGKELDKRFNHIVQFYFLAKGYSYCNIYRLVKESQCIHFAGGIDTRILRKMILMDIYLSHINIDILDSFIIFLLKTLDNIRQATKIKFK